MLQPGNALWDTTLTTSDDLEGNKLAYNLCIFIRTALAVSVMLGKLSRVYLITLCSLIIFIFSKKMLYLESIGKSTWKCYDKTILIYSIILYISIFNKKKDEASVNGWNKLFGGIMITEIVGGIMLRDLYNKLS